MPLGGTILPLILSFALLLGLPMQDQREAAIKSTQADVEGYKYDEDVGLKYKGVTRAIVRAENAGRCRTKFILEEEGSVVLDWTAIKAVTAQKYQVDLTAGKPSEAMRFEVDLADQATNFAEVFDYLRAACAGKK